MINIRMDSIDGECRVRGDLFHKDGFHSVGDKAWY